MIPNFTIVLKNEKVKTYTVISWFIIALNFILLVYVGVSGRSKIDNLPYFSAVLLLGIFVFRFISKREDFENDSLSLCFSIAIISWIVMQFYWAAAIVIVLFLFQDISRRKLTVLVFDDRVVYPSFPKRTIEWKEMNNMILKDGVLTIDLKNNKVYQNEINSPTSEIDLNEFCDTHLQAVRK